MSELNTLLNLLHTVSHLPISESVKKVIEGVDSEHGLIKRYVSNANVRHWAKALYTARIDNMNVNELIAGLKAVDKFTDADVAEEAMLYFLDIIISVDTDSIKSCHALKGQIEPPLLACHSKSDTKEPLINIDNRHSGSSSDCIDLVPDKTISWTFKSENKNDSIQLKRVIHSQYDSHTRQFRSEHIPTHADTHQFISYEIGELPSSPSSTYKIDFTINGRNQVFRIDPLN